MKKTKIIIEKRIFDVVMSIFLAIIFSPVFVLIFLLMIIENIFIPASRGSIIYSETRISAGQPFKIFKFRIFKKETIERNYDFVDTKRLEANKNNLTYTGRILKKFYLDELPQLFNILEGKMSLVGPRPTNVLNYEKSVARGDQAKSLMRAGLTGYFQTQKDMVSPHTQEELDMKYIDFYNHNSGWRIVLEDIKILLLTVLTVLRAKGV